MNFFLFVEQLCKSASAHQEPSLQPSEEERSNHAVDRSWKPLVLVVPLRLGLSEINPVYVQGLKVRAILTSLPLKAEREGEICPGCYPSS